MESDDDFDEESFLQKTNQMEQLFPNLKFIPHHKHIDAQSQCSHRGSILTKSTSKTQATCACSVYGAWTFEIQVDLCSSFVTLAIPRTNSSSSSVNEGLVDDDGEEAGHEEFIVLGTRSPIKHAARAPASMAASCPTSPPGQSPA